MHTTISVPACMVADAAMIKANIERMKREIASIFVRSVSIINLRLSSTRSASIEF